MLHGWQSHNRGQKIFVLRKKGSKTKKSMKEEEIEKGDCGPPTRKKSFFEILSNLNQSPRKSQEKHRSSEKHTNFFPGSQPTEAFEAVFAAKNKVCSGPTQACNTNGFTQEFKQLGSFCRQENQNLLGQSRKSSIVHSKKTDPWQPQLVGWYERRPLPNPNKVFAYWSKKKTTVFGAKTTVPGVVPSRCRLNTAVCGRSKYFFLVTEHFQASWLSFFRVG